MSREALVVAAATALAGGTWAVQTGWDRYDAVGAELLRDGGFDRGLAAWDAGTYSGALVAEGGAAVFGVDSPCAAATCGGILVQDLPLPDEAVVVVGASAQTEGVGGPASSVGRLHVYLLPRGADGLGLWDEATVVVEADGTTSWTAAEEGVTIAPHWASLAVVVQLRAAEGVARVDALSVRGGRARLPWVVGRAALAAGWAAVTGAAAALLATSPGTRWRAPFVAVCAIALVALLLPARVVDGAVDATVAALERPEPEIAVAPQRPAAPTATAASAEPAGELEPAGEPEPAGEVGAEEIAGDSALRDALREAGPHFTLFVVLAALAGLAWPSVAPAPLLARLLLFAGATEVLQLFTADRGPALEDVAADAAGSVVGLLLARLLAR